MWCHASYTAVEASLPLTLPAILEEAQLDCDQDNLDEILDDDAIDSDKPSTSSSTAVLRDPMTREFVFAIPLAARVERGYDARYSEVVRGAFKICTLLGFNASYWHLLVVIKFCIPRIHKKISHILYLYVCFLRFHPWLSNATQPKLSESAPNHTENPCLALFSGLGK